jgi:predicted XRE-type DNA-binding protein
MNIFENLDLKDLDGEIWKVIEYFPDYSVSNLGRVKSFKKWHGVNERILKQNKNSYDYFCISLSKNGKQETKLVHRLVYEAFKGKLEEGYDAHHINEDKEDNFVENLESKPHGKHTEDHNKGTHHSEKTKKKISRSIKEKFKNGELNQKGEIHSNFKLTNQKLIDIKTDIEKGNLTQREIAEKNGVSQSTISNIKNYKF